MASLPSLLALSEGPTPVALFAAVATELQAQVRWSRVTLRPGVQAYRAERGSDPATYVEMEVFNPVQPLRIEGYEVGQAEVQAGQAKLGMAPMIMAVALQFLRTSKRDCEYSCQPKTLSEFLQRIWYDLHISTIELKNPTQEVDHESSQAIDLYLEYHRLNSQKKYEPFL